MPVDYQQYIVSQPWKEKALRHLGAHPRCFVCNTLARLTVHHCTYARLGHEDAADLVTLCRQCHFTLHDMVDGHAPGWFLDTAHHLLKTCFDRKQMPTTSNKYVDPAALAMKQAERQHRANGTGKEFTRQLKRRPQNVVDRQIHDAILNTLESMAGAVHRDRLRALLKQQRVIVGKKQGKLFWRVLEAAHTSGLVDRVRGGFVQIRKG